MKNKVKLIYTHKSYLYLLGVLLLLLTTTFTASAQADSLYGLWVKRAPFGSKGSAEIKTSLTDEQGNVYLSGVFSGTLNFSDDICNPVMSSVSSSAKKALFFMKLDPAGKYQWHIVYEISQGIPDPSPDNFNATICDYKDGKLLLYGRLVYKGVMSTLGTKVTFNKLGSSNSTEYTKPTNSSSDTYFYFQFLHVINVADGSTKSFIDPFTAETHNLTARFQGDNIHTIHMGWDHIAYQNNNSQVSIFDSNGNQIGSNIAYPDQPYAAPGAPGCGSTIAKHVTLADGRQAMVHFSYDKVAPNVDIPSYYLLYYKGDYSKRDTMFLMSSRAIEYFPHITTDNSSNLYIATNYGKSEHWNTHVPFPNSNHLDNFLGSGKNFMTKPQTNKVVLARMNSDNTVKWIFQIGDNNDTDGRMIVANDMKTIGNRTYLVGQFMGGNLNFNGIELSNSGSTAPYWYWNWDVFYAVFDNETGACLYAVNMGNLNIDNAHNSDEGKTIYLSPDATHVLIGGTYDSPIFQSDPSNRLYPITSDGTNAHGFVAAYSTDYNSTPTPYASAFGDAPVSYGVVTNFAYPCLRLGELDFQKMQVEPAPSVDANTAQNDDAVILDTTANGYTNLSSANFTLLANGSLQAKVKVFNSIDEEAKLIGWIDFNRNGIFDENEASDLLIIPALSNSTTRTLTWTSASGRIRNGETYLRVRLSTDNLLPSTPSGLLFTGDVEDYKLNFNILSVEKTAVSDNSYDNGRAIIGDTITYSISIKNNSPIEMQVSGLYDPIPDSTVYITGSASPTGTLGAVTIGSESVNAISWPAVTIPAAGMANYSFKVALRAIPKADSVINNIAYVLLNNDTIPSTGTNCYLAPIIVDSLIVADDYAQTIKNKPVVIPVLENDVVDCNFSGDAITSGLNGTAVWNSTYDSITYTPNADFVGIDSFTYTIKCGDGSGTATVYVAVVDLPDNIVDFDCVDEPTGFSWSFQPLGNSTQTVATHSPILAGDMDNDGHIEVVTLGTGNGYGTIKLIYIFDDELKVKYTINFAPAVNPIASSMAIADVDRDGYAELYICAEDGYLYKYIHNKQAYDGANYVYDNKAQFTTDLRYVGATPIITDFNGDGFPEISVLDKVFDAATLALLVDGQQLGTGDLGFGAGHAITATGNNKLPSIMAVGDVDGDGLPELVAGSTVYKIKINSRTNQSENSFTVYKQADKTGRTDVGDGATALADMDLDGKLDVIVTRRISSSAGAVYVWNPRTGEIMNTNSISNLSVYPASGQFGPFGPSMPFVGDIDGDKKPEVVVVANNMVRAYDFDNGTLTDKWNISTTDYSASTAITLFDFDQDGNAELIYRDCNNLRVLNGLDGSNKIAPYKCGSSTGQEYPIVVDLNQDGAAEIIVTGDLNGNSDAAIGYLRVFGSNPQGNWAPARKVWNQYPYNAVNVNDDLTIPKLQLNPATVFPGKDGEYGTADDVYPYNAYLQQQTFLNANGVPVFTLPDLQWTSTNPAFNYYGVGDSLVITVEVKNDGDAAIGAPVYFTAYKDAVTLANVLAGGTYNNQIMPDSTISFSFRIDSLMTKYSPISQIIVRLNDSINKYPYQQECITSDSIRSKNISDLLMAMPDTASTIYNTPVIIDVLANDILGACTPSSLSEFDVLPRVEQKGVASISGTKIHYIPQPNYIGFDTVHYYIKCGSDSSAASIFIKVHDEPSNIIDSADCTVPFGTFDFTITRKWQTANGTAHRMSGVLVGDLDGDGVAEIAVYGNVDNGNNNINIFDGSSKALKAQIAIPSINGTGGWRPAMVAVMVDADRNGLGEIIVARSNRQIISYECDTVGGFKMKQKWVSPVLFDNPTSADNIPHPNVADLNGDGVPELIVYNKIYNAATGAYLGQTEPIASAFVGRLPAQKHNKATNFEAIADIDGDGKLEIIAGGKVYKVHFNADNTAVTCSILYERPSIGDGLTSIADLDLDGKLDVVVAKPVNNTDLWIYMWSPTDNRMIDSLKVTTIGSSQYNGMSFPFVGDIDGDIENGKKYPEICINTAYKVFSYKYNPATAKYSQKWVLSTSDESGATGITLFDFNNDMVSELVYRDQSEIRILNGTSQATLNTPLARFGCGSSTAYEYPTIADVDGDGSANICVTCDPYLVVYESASTPWAPAPKVWNQVNYEPLLINNDLTTPRMPIPKNMKFKGEYPYNGALIQVPVVDTAFNLFRVAPDPAVVGMKVESLGDNYVKVCVDIQNRGKANINSDLPVTLYHTSYATSNVLRVEPIGALVHPGDIISLCWDSVSIDSSYAQLLVRIQDDGVKFPADGSFLDCNMLNNTDSLSMLLAVNDVVVSHGDSIKVDVLANDFLAACAKGSTGLLFELIPNTGLNNGDFIKNADSTFTYKPTTGFYGIDSTDYFIQCNADSSAARVYFLVTKPLSLSYYACPSQHPDDVVKIGFHKITGITYNWYTVATGGTKLATTDSSYNVIKDNSAVQTWWAEPVYNGIVFPRIEINLYLADGCGEKNPVGCAVDGTILFREDFGGNSPEDPANKPEGIPQVIGLTYEPDALANNSLGGYTIAKRNITGPHTMWSKALIDDHTYPNDVTRGYLLMADAANIGNQFYKTTIKNLCEGTNLYFSAWASSVISFYAWTMDTPNFLFTLESNGVVIASYNTGDIPNNDLAWKQYGFNFTVPNGVDSLVLRIINNGRGGNGNDFVLDDIEIRLCAPPVTITPPALVCPRDSFMLTGTYTDSPVTFGDDLVYFWEYSQTGDINEPSEWVTWGTGGTSSNGSINATEGDIATTDKEGYYRLVVGKASTINSSSCRASSEPVYIGLHKTILHYPDVRVQVCPTPDRQLNLNQYIDTVDLVKVDWTRIGVASPILNGDGHSINTGGMLAPTVYAYKYTAENSCLSQSGTVYLTALSDETRHLPPDTVQVCYEVADALLLNQLLGVEAGGTWVYDNTVNPDNVVASFVTESVLPSVSAGAVTFNGKSAWGVLGAAYDYTFRSVPGKKVVFKYRTPSTSCLGETEKTMVIILTDVVQ